MKKFISACLLATGVALSGGALASPINVGGVIWDPEEDGSGTNALPDFSANGSLIETVVPIGPGGPVVGGVVSGFGIVTQVNSGVPNGASFCPSCELTFTFSMNLASAATTPVDPLDPTQGFNGAFTFDNLVIDMFVDAGTDGLGNYAQTSATAGDGNLWLSMAINGVLSGTGFNLGTGSDLGAGSGLLDAVGGLALANFDTNTQLNGADFSFTSSFLPIIGGPNDGLLQGTFDLKGDSIPEPGTLALLGLGLLGLGAARKRKI